MGLKVVIDVVEELFEVGPLVDVKPEDVEIDFVAVDDEPLDAPLEVLVDFVLVGDVLVGLGPVVDVEEVVDVPEIDFGVSVELDVDVGGANEASVVEVATARPGVRYQFISGSWRHSPAVTPFQPLAWISP